MTVKKRSLLTVLLFLFLLSISNYFKRLRTGWSTGKTTTTSLDPAERDAIIEVVQRNELLENAERERIGRIIERVEKIKQRVVTDFGPKNCR